VGNVLKIAAENDQKLGIIDTISLGVNLYIKQRVEARN